MKIHNRGAEAGFNLLELMIVISVIALLISVSGYAWQVMIRRGNEAAGVTYLNKINTAQAYYASKHNGSFASGFKVLVDSNLLEKSFKKEKPTVDGYRFTLKTDDSPSKYFSINADPEIGAGIRATGGSSYFPDRISHKGSAFSGITGKKSRPKHFPHSNSMCEVFWT